MKEDGVYKPGDIILIRAKIKSITEDDAGKVTYKVMQIEGNIYSTLEVCKDDIRGHMEEHLN